MARLRPLVAIIACLVGAAVLGWRTIAELPPKQGELTKIEGVVRTVATGTRSSRRDSANYPLIRIEGRSDSYKYLDWFPNPDRIYEEIRPGEQVRLFSDTPKGNHWVWQIEKDGRTIVSYAEVLEAVRANRRWDPYLALAMGVAGVSGLYFFVRSMRKSLNQTPLSAPPSVPPPAA